MSAIATIKRAFFTTSDKFGFNRALRASAWRRKRLLILCYHGVAYRDEHEWSDLYVTQDFLAERLSQIATAGLRVLSLDAALHELWTTGLTRPTVALTFDDGLSDFVHRAIPVLEAHHYQATVYLTTYYAEHQLPVFNPLANYLIWKGAGRRAVLGPLGQASLPARSDKKARAALHLRLLEACAISGLNALDKNEVARTLAESINVDFQAIMNDRFMHVMNANEVRSLPADLIDVELHTHRHRSPGDRAAFYDEIRRNDGAIRSMTADSRHRRHFCYPSGLYGDDIRRYLSELDVESATTCDPGFVTASTDHLLLPRFVDTMSVSRNTFAAWLAGTAALLPRRRADGRIQL